MPPGIPHPNDINATVQMHRSVTVLNESFRPTNTVRAHKPKIYEYFEFCDAIYPDELNRYQLTGEKVFRFMFYTAFRGLKPRGGKKGQSKPHFDVADYHEVMSNYDGVPRSPGDAPMPVQARKPISYQTFDQYKQVLQKIYHTQKLEKSNALYWAGDIWQQPCQDLAKQVKTRVAHVKKATYQEKVGAEFAPYTIVESYPAIEQELWNDCVKAVGPRQIACQLRHRYCAQHTATGILRAESLYRAEWSDFIIIQPPRLESDVHPIQIMVNQVSQGKTNHGRLLYGRAIRHRDVRLCAVGALSAYMMYRFFVTNEFSNLTVDDWLDNETWFDIKLLADTNSDDKTKEMGKDSYGTHISKVLQRLGLPMNKLLHLGRNIGSKILELLEEEQDCIRQMGNWNPSMFDVNYSTKLPIKPMRKLAGFHGNHRIYYNTRTSVEPPEVLLLSTPVGIWVYSLHEELMKDSRIADHPTAMFVVRFFMEMNRIFLQDMTAMAVLHPERMEHAMYREFPLFQSTQWLVSTCGAVCLEFIWLWLNVAYFLCTVGV
jgi:hypothetical protein